MFHHLTSSTPLLQNPRYLSLQYSNTSEEPTWYVTRCSISTTSNWEGIPEHAVRESYAWYQPVHMHSTEVHGEHPTNILRVGEATLAQIQIFSEWAT